MSLKAQPEMAVPISARNVHEYFLRAASGLGRLRNLVATVELPTMVTAADFLSFSH